MSNIRSPGNSALSTCQHKLKNNNHMIIIRTRFSGRFSGKKMTSNTYVSQSNTWPFTSVISVSLQQLPPKLFPSLINKGLSVMFWGIALTYNKPKLYSAVPCAIIWPVAAHYVSLLISNCWLLPHPQPCLHAVNYLLDHLDAC